MRRKRGEKRPPSSSLDGRRDGYWGDVELILRDAEGRGINLSGGSRAVAARLKQILVHGGLEALAIESWEAEELTRFVNDGLFREVYLRAVQHLGLATPPKPDAVQVEIEAVSEDAEEFDIIFRARLPAGRTVPTTEGDKPGPDCDLVMRLRVKRSEMIRTHPEFVVRDLSVEAHDPRVENPAPILEFDTEGHTSAAPLLTEQQIKAVADTNRVRLKDDFGGHVNQLARSLAERLRDRPDIPLLLTTGDVRREPISEEADWNEMLNHLGQWSPRRVSRLLNDRIFLDYYGHVVRRLGVDPPPDPRDVDVVLETRKNEYRAVDSYEVSFRARLPDSVIVRGKNGNFRGSQCDLTLNISTRYTESFDEDPQSEIGEPRIEVHGIEGGENDVPPPSRPTSSIPNPAGTRTRRRPTGW